MLAGQLTSRSNDCEILTLLEGDSVMADKGLEIEDDLPDGAGPEIRVFKLISHVIMHERHSL